MESVAGLLVSHRVSGDSLYIITLVFFSLDLLAVVVIRCCREGDILFPILIGV